MAKQRCLEVAKILHPRQVRWARGGWTDMETELLLPAPAFMTAGRAIAKRAGQNGLEAVLAGATLLHDRDESDAWANWFEAAGLPYRPHRNSLVIPDPNVRVQAVIDGQGLALNDNLVAPELEASTLIKLSDVELSDYGFHLDHHDIRWNHLMS
jgi:DNA-binding transcriptional LysR family regulator